MGFSEVSHHATVQSYLLLLPLLLSLRIDHSRIDPTKSFNHTKRPQLFQILRTNQKNNKKNQTEPPRLQHFHQYKYYDSIVFGSIGAGAVADNNFQLLIFEGRHISTFKT